MLCMCCEVSCQDEGHISACFTVIILIKLLQLPVPPLHQTLERLLRSVKPVVSADQLKATAAAAAECVHHDITSHRIISPHSFSRPGGVGEQLQSLLAARAQSRRNWLADWWFDYAYLGFRRCDDTMHASSPDTRRSPVVIHSNPSMTIAAPSSPRERDQCWRAAAITLGALQYSELINRAQVPVEYHKVRACGVFTWRDVCVCVCV